MTLQRRNGLGSRPLARAADVVIMEMKRSVWAMVARRRDPMNRVVSLSAEGRARGHVLVSFRLEPFIVQPGEAPPRGHTNYWMTCEIVRTFLGLGYAVDVVSHRNPTFFPRKDYAVVVDCRTILERIAPLLDDACVKIMHLDTAHMLFHDAAEARRLLAVQRRRGVTLPSSRFETPNLGIEHADCGTTWGNDFTIETFRYAGKPIYRLPVAPAAISPWPDGKDFDACRRRFLFFSSHGMVHKGLDLVLEAFAEMPDLHLTVCAPADREPAFVRAYQRELYGMPNIHTVGWIDVDDPRFAAIMRSCGAVINPSCSEAGCAATIECLHAGLVPIVSRGASVDVNDFGLLLSGDGVDDVKKAVQQFAALTATEVGVRARAAWEHARSVHTRERFTEAYRTTAKTILDVFHR